ncbi:hypothetical protein COW46_04575 [Candidatus Gracilibacteria bacterium CG17_big_fil_post_rev_8_21_14_2_50_48_13]|nr:MAG: hypothetical protein COW46_04575 [Candidatus Gracilibacteria bacterium CG17_big_fil_post_rev_8_21_14_2_50_48_13]
MTSRKKKIPVARRVSSWLAERKEQLQEFGAYVEEMRREREKKLAHEMPLLEDTKASSEKEIRAKVDISVSSVVKASIAVALVAIGLYMLFLLTNIIALVLISFFLAAILNPFVDFLEKYRIPRGAGVLISYILILLAIAVFIILLVPMLRTQGDKLVQSISSYLLVVAREGITTLPIPFLPDSVESQAVATINQLRTNFNLDLLFEQFRAWLIENQTVIGGSLETAATNFFGFLNVVANGLGNVIVVLLLTFFAVADKQGIKSFVLRLLPVKHRHYFDGKLSEIQVKIGSWIRGQLLLGLAVGLATFLGFLILSLFGMHFEEMGILSVLAGVTEVIPVVGPIIAAVFAVLVAANYGIIQVLAVLIMFIAIQQLENNILVPVIMRHAVGLSSLVIIVCMLIGAQFFGFLGLILAVPVSTIISLFVHDFMNNHNGG